MWLLGYFPGKTQRGLMDKLQIQPTTAIDHNSYQQQRCPAMTLHPPPIKINKIESYVISLFVRYICVKRPPLFFLKGPNQKIK